MKWSTHKQKLLKNSRVRESLEESALEYQIARAIISARISRGLTQTSLATKLNTKQSVISRIENAQTTPSVSFLRRLAHALDAKLSIEFKL